MEHQHLSVFSYANNSICRRINQKESSLFVEKWLAIGVHPEHDSATLIDIRDIPGVLKMDIRKLDFPNATFDGVELHHVLEHLERSDAPIALHEILRVLKPGGIFEISVPDLKRCAQSLLAGDFRVIDNIYSSNDDPIMHHRWGYTPESLENILNEVGFVKPIVMPEHHRDAHSIRIHCERPRE
jgi:predicted SAM-dependent methyltransferase